MSQGYAILISMKAISLILGIFIVLQGVSAAPVIGSDCTLKGKKLWGKVKIVTFGEHLKVKPVDFGENLKVRFRDFSPGKCGQWQIVSFGEDLKIRFVDYGEDLKIRIVEYGEGLR